MASTTTRTIDKSGYGYIRAIYTQSDVFPVPGSPINDKYANLTVEIQADARAWRNDAFTIDQFTGLTLHLAVRSDAYWKGDITTRVTSSSATSWVQIGRFNAQIRKSWLSNPAIVPILITLVSPSGGIIPSDDPTLPADHISASQGGQGTQNIAAQAWDIIDTLTTPSSMTTNTSSTFGVTHVTSGNTNTLRYSIGSYSGTIVEKTASTSISWTPPSDLCYAIPNSASGKILISQTTYTSSGAEIGSASYEITLNAESYSLFSGTLVASKKAPYDIYPNFVTGKTVALISFPSGLPSGTSGYKGSTIVSKVFRTSFGSVTSEPYSDINFGPSTVLEAGPAGEAGNLVGTLTVTDSRGRSQSTSVTMTYVANGSVNITEVTSQRSNGIIVGTIKGTFNATYTPLTITKTSSPTITVNISSPTISGNNFTYTFTTGTFADNRTLTLTFKVTDGLGNSDSEVTTVGPAFSYFEITPQKVISIGQTARSGASNEIEFGLPVKTAEPIHFTNDNGQILWSLDPSAPITHIIKETLSGPAYDSNLLATITLRRIFYGSTQNSSTPAYAEIIVLYDIGSISFPNSWGSLLETNELWLPAYGITFSEIPSISVTPVPYGSGIFVEGPTSTSFSPSSGRTPPACNDFKQGFGKCWLLRGSGASATGARLSLRAFGKYTGSMPN